jgi:pathogenesis-related protein 1
MGNQSGVASAATLAQVRAEYVAAHNKWRATVGVPALTYSVAQEAVAQAWVNQLQAQGCGLVHSNPLGQYGENLFGAWGASYTPTQIVDTWAGENVYYNYAANTCAAGQVCGHYTQIVWRNTTSIGCATATCPATQQQVVACQYTPPGNYVGQKPY